MPAKNRHPLHTAFNAAQSLRFFSEFPSLGRSSGKKKLSAPPSRNGEHFSQPKEGLKIIRCFVFVYALAVAIRNRPTRITPALRTRLHTIGWSRISFCVLKTCELCLPSAFQLFDQFKKTLYFLFGDSLLGEIAEIRSEIRQIYIFRSCSDKAGLRLISRRSLCRCYR